MIQAGAQLAAQLGLERTALALASFLLVGALANAAAGVIQHIGRPAPLDALIAELRGHRAYGNIAQVNLYANYLALGAASLLFLWLRGWLRTAVAAAALGLIAVGSALSGSRSALLYALWFAALAPLAARLPDRTEAARLKRGALAVAAALVLAHLAVPWLSGVAGLGRGGGVVERFAGPAPEEGEPRLVLLQAAWRVFAEAPLAGAGMGEFAGAAFAQGLDPSLTRMAQVWTSPHNLPLQLLAEAGIVGAALVLGALAFWALQFARGYRVQPGPALWWIAAAVGVALLHSLVEFPLWNAHFLGVTALLAGVGVGIGADVGVRAGAEAGAGAAAGVRATAYARAAQLAGFAAIAAMAIALALLLRDYVRLDAARVTGTAPTLAPATQVQRDAATMQALRGGLLAPQAELWILLGASLDRNGLADKLALSARVARVWPANAVIVRRAVFLALDGKGADAQALLARALRSFPHARSATLAILGEALPADPAAIGALLRAANGAAGK
jgi:O-antigen ligase